MIHVCAVLTASTGARGLNVSFCRCVFVVVSCVELTNHKHAQTMFPNIQHKDNCIEKGHNHQTHNNVRNIAANIRQTTMSGHESRNAQQNTTIVQIMTPQEKTNNNNVQNMYPYIKQQCSDNCTLKIEKQQTTNNLLKKQ